MKIKFWIAIALVCGTLSLIGFQANAQSVSLVKHTYYNGYNITCNGLSNGSIDATVLNDTPRLC